ncbi:EamA family transporter [Nocardia arthritidis]|uniref:EamA family transporter n=2 Tax=Nocardia arthritidis TaxID=228602 RepID=A0A6G9YJM6_9NOCA|nr:EamA family transporter [Nocardia arthritidis]
MARCGHPARRLVAVPSQERELFMSTVVSTARRSGLISLIAAGILWGTGGLLGALLGRATGLAPIAVAACRLGTGGLLLILTLIVTRRPMPRNRLAWRRIGAIAALAGWFQMCYFGAVAASSVSLATLITIGMSPVFVAVLEQLTGRRALDRRRVATIGLALSGLTLLVGGPATGSAAGLLLGAALAAAAAAGFAIMTLISADPVDGLEPMTTTALGFTGGAVLLAPLAASTGLSFTVTPTSIALLLALGLFPTAAAYSLYFHGLPAAGPGTTAAMALLEPLTGTILAAVILGDRLRPLALVGAALLVAALLLAARAASDIEEMEG